MTEETKAIETKEEDGVVKVIETITNIIENDVNTMGRVVDIIARIIKTAKWTLIAFVVYAGLNGWVQYETAETIRKHVELTTAHVKVTEALVGVVETLKKELSILKGKKITDWVEVK